jgi:hypothetical protein
MEAKQVDRTGEAVRATKILLIVLLLAAHTELGAQSARPTTGAPEIFNATASAKTAKSAISGALEVRVTRYTPDFDRKTVEEALRLGGYPRFLTALRNAPEVGQLVLGDGQPYTIRYARETVEAGTRTIIVVTDRPVFFVGTSGAGAAKPRAGFEVAVLQIQLDATGRARGTIAAAARVRPNGDGGVLLDDYADEPIALTNITRKSS